MHINIPQIDLWIHHALKSHIIQLKNYCAQNQVNSTQIKLGKLQIPIKAKAVTWSKQ